MGLLGTLVKHVQFVCSVNAPAGKAVYGLALRLGFLGIAFPFLNLESPGLAVQSSTIVRSKKRVWVLVGSPEKLVHASASSKGVEPKRRLNLRLNCDALS